MNFLENLNFLATIGTFACVSFALSGFGVKLGKFSSEPHTLGFKYISRSSNSDKLYEATVALNKHNNLGAPEWAKNKDSLIEKCKAYEKSTRKWVEVSGHCLIRKNVWHQLIEAGVTLKDNLIENRTSEQETAGTGSAVTNEECTFQMLSSFADGDGHVNYLIGKKFCAKDTSIVTSQTLVSASG